MIDARLVEATERLFRSCNRAPGTLRDELEASGCEKLQILLALQGLNGQRAKKALDAIRRATTHAIEAQAACDQTEVEAERNRRELEREQRELRELQEQLNAPCATLPIPRKRPA